MIGHIIVGKKKAGKTYFIQKMILENVHKGAILVYDVNNEYAEYTDNETLPNIDEFSDTVSRVKNAVCVFEECTIFTDTRSNNKFLKNLLVRTRHTKNYIIMVFHSVRSIPRNIFEISDYITVFDTLDSPDLSAKELKDERIETIMKEVSENVAENPHYCKTLALR